MSGKKRLNVQVNRVPGIAASLKNATSLQASMRVSMKASAKASAAFIGAAVLVACGGTDTVTGPAVNSKPSFLKTVNQISYDGVSDDLLTAGLGKIGLAGVLPAFADPLKPTAPEMRRAAVYNNYRALLDMTAAGGYGTLYGPNVDAAGIVGTGEGRVAGAEYIAYSDDGTGSKNVTLMVQVPANFSKASPCIITATASGSRGVYGGLSTGEWGLKRGCAVAYSDKGTGAAPHDLAADTVPLIDGTRAGAAAAGSNAAFRANISSAELAAFNAATPNRFAFKHAHSQQNPEADWGRSTLQAVEFAYWVINEKFGDTDASGARLKTLTPANTIVIASSLSNGGGAAIAALEQDTQGLISGLAVSEPQVQLPLNPGVSVRRGNTTLPVSGKSLIDYTALANLYQPCAALSPQLAGSPGSAFVVAAFAANRCTSLKTKGLLTASTTPSQADEALQKLRDYGWERESDVLHVSLAAFEVASAVSVTYANALSRASVRDNLCGYSFAATDVRGTVTRLEPISLALMFATGNGVPPSAGVQLINNNNLSGGVRDLFSVSPSTGLTDFNLDGALCLRNLVAGTDAAALKMQAGVNEMRRNGNLRGKPAIIVHGRDDALLPVSHTSRPYFALNKVAEGAASKLSYIEVTNAQHFDTFIGLPTVLPGYDTRYIPLHVYLNRALDAVYDNLKSGKALPASQVVRTVARGGTAGAAPAITAANVPAIAATPAAADAITFAGSTVTVPQ